MAYFQKVRFVFQISKSPEKNIPKNYPELEILNFPPKTLCGKFKFHAQDSLLEYFFLEIWRFEKRITLSEKKPPLEQFFLTVGQNNFGNKIPFFVSNFMC